MQRAFTLIELIIVIAIIAIIASIAIPNLLEQKKKQDDRRNSELHINQQSSPQQVPVQTTEIKSGSNVKVKATGKLGLVVSSAANSVFNVRIVTDGNPKYEIVPFFDKELELLPE